MSRRDEPRSLPPHEPSHANRPTARGVLCYRCGIALEVPAKAQSASCPACHRQIHVADLVLRGPYWGAPVLTCGAVVIQKKARIVTSRVVSSVGVTVLGSLEAEVVTPGTLVIGPKGSLVGNVRAAGLLIEPGGTLVGKSVAVAEAARVDGINWTETGSKHEPRPEPVGPRTTPPTRADPRITVTTPRGVLRETPGTASSPRRVG